ncbi:queuine tRNA-ribosyltransferase [Sulfolobus acidocaldarius DSM 639]|uniref:tRNA-guanine(15) transglycosylase n=5 Tax=Sulfolobus acidocaldarius TaxID=2285 RepID=ATGT_SULAC|nr:RecName: Full=tRNA-guanine(15) transglycosylase; AltName: Full=7-cyano-7-deazaguanine tRNA-ribosyltransferase; AltName: Full=Archaeal tRNA-guanine transglycosylase [Sulfolobus acidocaldarius DSM 639]AAY80043.1 queuine tRNA-ribosyltransferase [Sulfolobus acidocaldarius DSM 639]
MIGDFEIKDEDLAGRIGILETKHGKLETPAFFPVINPVKNEITIQDILSVGFESIITNAFLIKKYIGKEEDLHSILNYNKILMTDSGAYQILQYGDIDVSNVDIVNYETKLKPDIAVILDIPTGLTEDKKEAEKSVESTISRAKEASKFVELSKDEIIWVHPIQGGMYLDLIEYSARIADMNQDYKMLALGSPTVLMQRYEYAPLIDMIYKSKSNVSRGKPFHLFGGGHPHIFAFAVALGVDTFDSASYILYARDHRYMTRERVYRLEELDYFPCSCPICSRYSPKDVMEMPEEQKVRLIALHNLYVIKEEINYIKQSLKEGRLFEYIQQKAYSHPSTFEAFRRILNYSKYLEKYDPRVKGEVKGVFLFDNSSLHRPEVIRHAYTLSKIKQRSKALVLYCSDSKDNPLKNTEDMKNADVYIVLPFYGCVPYNVFFTYPYFQSEMPSTIDKDVIYDLKNKLKEFLSQRSYETVSIIGCEKILHVDSIRGAPVNLLLNKL